MVILSEHGDMMVFTSVEDAIDNIEAIDVLYDEYIFYNEDGDILHAIVEDYQVLSFENTGVNKREELDDALRGWLRRLRRNDIRPSIDWIEGASITELLNKVKDIC